MATSEENEVKTEQQTEPKTEQENQSKTEEQVEPSTENTEEPSVELPVGGIFRKRYQKAKEIKKWQEEIQKLEEKLDNDKLLSDEQRESLKCQIKEYKGLIFETKHPILAIVGHFFSSLHGVSNQAYRHENGGDEYTDQDMERVQQARVEDGPVGEARERAEIEERIERERE